MPPQHKSKIIIKKCVILIIILTYILLPFSVLLLFLILIHRVLQTVLNYPFKQLKKHWNSFPFDATGGIWSRFLAFPTFSLYPDSCITTLKKWFYQLYERNLKSIFIKWKYIFTVKMTRTKDKDVRGMFSMVPGFHLPQYAGDWWPMSQHQSPYWSPNH